MMYSKLSNPYQETNLHGLRMNLEHTGNHDDRIYQPGVKIVVDNSPVCSIYSAYEDLPDYFKDSKDFRDVINRLQEQAREDNDWKQQFDIIDNLRILNKFYPLVLRDNVNQFSLFILGCMDNLRTNLSKNALLLVKEININLKQAAPNDDFINIILPKILEKGISDKSFIKLEARSALKALENGGCYDSVIKVLCEKSFDKNVNVSELSFQTLVITIREAKENLGAQLSQQTVELLFHTLIGTINGKRAANKRLAEDLCQQLRGAFPENEDELEGYLKDKLNLKEQGAKTIIKAMQNKKEKVVKSDLSSFIKERKLKKGPSDGKNRRPEMENSNSYEGDEI